MNHSNYLMNRSTLPSFLTVFLLVKLALIASSQPNNPSSVAPQAAFTDAAIFGFSPTETGVKNTKALQAAFNKGGRLS